MIIDYHAIFPSIRCARERDDGKRMERCEGLQCSSYCNSVSFLACADSNYIVQVF